MSAQLAPIEVFYSYADADESLRIELDKHLSQLRRDGLITTWHKRQIVAGMDWTKAQDPHLNTASVILLLVSADFIASDYCYGVEMQQAMERNATGEAHVIPLLLRPVDWQSTPFGKLQALPGNGTPITMWRNRDAAFADVAQGIRAALQAVQRLAVSTPRTSFPRIWNIPYPRNPVFTGRQAILSQIETQLQKGQTTAISQAQALSGLGGIGKTQVAVEYAYQHARDYQAVFWTLVDTPESLVSGYVAIAGLLNLPQKDEQDQTMIVQAIKNWLQTHGSWLLILDNADDLAMVREFIPPTFGGHLLLTTRAQSMGRLAKGIEVDTMSQDMGALFLLRRVGLIEEHATLDAASSEDVTIARSICEELGGLPLALDQAGAFIEETQGSLAEYMYLCRIRKAEILKERGGLVDDHREGVSTTWSISFAKVEEKNVAAADLLRLCAFLAPDAIPEEIITKGADHLGPHLQKLGTDPLLLKRAIAALGAYSLVRRNLSDQTLSVHRLVQAVLKDTMDESTRKQWAERAVLAVNAVFPAVEFKPWPQCEQYLSHALSCAELFEQNQISSLEAANLLNMAGEYLFYRARYVEAEPLYKRALSIREQKLGAMHPDTAGSLNNLAELYYAQGKYKDAEPLHKRAISIREQKLGAMHPDTARSLNELAVLYYAQGKYEDAEPLYRRVITICEQQLGAMHPSTTMGMNNLAVLYKAQGKYEDAEPLYQRVLAIREQELGAMHPSTATSLNNLAALFDAQSKYEEALPLHQRALAIEEQQLGEMHPNTAGSLNNLAILYYEQGKYEMAEPLFKRALLIRQQILGTAHPATQNTRERYVQLLRKRGRNDEATTLETEGQLPSEEH